MMQEWFYDRTGDKRFYLEEDRFLNTEGKQIATLEGEDIIVNSGEMVGTFRSGVVFDTDGRMVAFIENAKGYIPTAADVTGSSGMADQAYAPGGLGLSGEPYVPVSGDWSDVTLEDFFGTEL